MVEVLLLRTWYLLIPMLAFSWYNSKQVTPKAAEIEAERIEEEKAIEQERTRILAGVRQVEVRKSMLRALADTFQTRFAEFDVLIDSVRTLQEIDLAETQRLVALADSLRSIYSQGEGQAAAHSESLTVLQARMEELRAAIVAREEETVKVEAEVVANRDLADRILNPNKYRKNSALMTGEGDFPERDKLPPR